MVFVGRVPAPPIESADASNGPSQLCAKLTSRADDCTSGQPGPESRMRFTISVCDPDAPGVPPMLLKSEPNEGKFVTTAIRCLCYCYYAIDFVVVETRILCPQNVNEIRFEKYIFS